MSEKMNRVPKSVSRRSFASALALTILFILPFSEPALSLNNGVKTEQTKTDYYKSFSNEISACNDLDDLKDLRIKIQEVYSKTEKLSSVIFLKLKDEISDKVFILLSQLLGNPDKTIDIDELKQVYNFLFKEQSSYVNILTNQQCLHLIDILRLKVEIKIEEEIISAKEKEELIDLDNRIDEALTGKNRILTVDQFLELRALIRERLKEINNKVSGS
jgi:hypothetical protein